MIFKKNFKSFCYLIFRRVHVKFRYNSKFNFIAKSLVTKLCSYNEGPLYICWDKKIIFELLLIPPLTWNSSFYLELKVTVKYKV